MFDERQIRAYNSIKAPDALYNKIKAKRKNYSWAVVAACLVCIFALGVFFIPEKNEIKVNGIVLENNVVLVKESVMARSTLVPVSIEIEIKEETEVEVSGGYLVFDGKESKKLTLNEPCTVIWMAEEQDLPQEMKISDKKGVTKLTLIYENEQYIIKKEK